MNHHKSRNNLGNSGKNDYNQIIKFNYFKFYN